MGRFGESTGSWEISIDNSNIRIILVPRDYQTLRNLMLDKNKQITEKINDFESLLIKMIRRDDPPLDKQEEQAMESFVARNAMQLFDEAMITCRLTTKEERQTLKDNAFSNAKKKIDETFQ